MLKITNLSKQVGSHRILDSISFEFVSGKIYQLVGENGVGKSTLLDILAGLNQNFSGKISGNLAVKTNQNPHIFLDATVADSLTICRPPTNLFGYLKPSNSITPQQLELLNYFSLNETLHKKIRHLSYGQKKLIDLIRVLSIDSDCYIFDESFTGLSEVNTNKLKKLILELKQQQKIIILVDHNLQISELVDEVITLESGKIKTSKN